MARLGHDGCEACAPEIARLQAECRRLREDVATNTPPARPTTAPRLWAFFSPTGRLLTTTDYEAGLEGTEHGLSAHYVGPFTRVEYVPVESEA